MQTDIDNLDSSVCTGSSEGHYNLQHATRGRGAQVRHLLTIDRENHELIADVYGGTAACLAALDRARYIPTIVHVLWGACGEQTCEMFRHSMACQRWHAICLTCLRHGWSLVEGRRWRSVADCAEMETWCLSLVACC